MYLRSDRGWMDDKSFQQWMSVYQMGFTNTTFTEMLETRRVCRGVCYICKEKVWDDQPRDLVNNGDYRHKLCAIKGQCPHCEKNVIVGQGKRMKVDSKYWHSDCYEQHTQEKNKREAEEKRQAEEKRKQEEIAKRRAAIHAENKCKCVLCEKSVTCAQKHTKKFDGKYTAHHECTIRAKFAAYKKKRTEEDYTESYYMQESFCSECGEETGDWEDCGFVNGSFRCQNCIYSKISVGTCRVCKCNITMQDRCTSEISKDTNGKTIIKNTMHDNLGYHCYACVEEEKKQENELKKVSFLSGTHSRLGAESHLQSLKTGTFALIWSFVEQEEEDDSIIKMLKKWKKEHEDNLLGTLV